MAFTYGGNPKENEVDALRFALGDTVESTSIFSNTELEYILETYDTGAKQLAVAYEHAANKIAHKPNKRSLGPQTEDNTERFKYFIGQAKKYKALSSISNLPVAELVDAVFDKGMMSNV